MTLSSFRTAPRQGLMDRAKIIVGYLYKMKHASIRFCTKVPDYSNIPIPEYGWERSIYGSVEEIIPDYAPAPYGPHIVMTTYVDANLCYNMVTGKSVTGIIHILNQTVINKFSKKQPVVETATYGSEFIAAWKATEQVIKIRTALRYLGVNIRGSTYMFGDNRAVVDSASTPKARLHKIHVLLSFHRVREAIAARIVHFIFTPKENNAADMLRKH